MSRRVPNPKNRVAGAIERRILELALEQPAWRQTRMADELAKQGIRVSPTGVRSALVRHDLDTMAKRLKALEAKVAQDGLIPNEDRLAARRRRRRTRKRTARSTAPVPATAALEAHLPCRHAEGKGRIYQQTFIDTYAKVGFAELGACPRARRSRDPGDVETAITAADLLNDRVLPFYDEHGIPLCRVLTDRGSEFCGNPERHEYELYLAIEDIDHSRTKAKSPQTNGIRERFHKTMLDEFYRVAFRKKLYRGLAEPQADVDLWLR